MLLKTCAYIAVFHYKICI